MPHHLTSPEINAYAESITTPESPSLKALSAETMKHVEQPQMMSGHLQGAALTMFSMMIRPKRILEIGTYTGYSAICLARGLAHGGELHTIDNREARLPMCRKYWAEEKLSEVIIPHIGAAKEIIPGLDGPFELVFIDADKVNYGLYYDLVFEKVSTGGFILADNVLYHSEVILPQNEQGRNARAMHTFNEKILADDRVEKVLLPIRDGILIMRKRD